MNKKEKNGKNENIFLFFVVAISLIMFCLVIGIAIDSFHYDLKHRNYFDVSEFNLYKKTDYEHSYIVEIDNNFYTISDKKIKISDKNSAQCSQFDDSNTLYDKLLRIGEENFTITKVEITPDTAEKIGYAKKVY